MKEYDFEIPRPFQTLQEFTERGWSTENPGKGTEMRYRDVTQPVTNATIQCPYSAYGVFLMHCTTHGGPSRSSRRTVVKHLSSRTGRTTIVQLMTHMGHGWMG